MSTVCPTGRNTHLSVPERATKPERSFKDWRTYRMSNHLPIWIELCIEDSDAYLATLALA